MYNESPAKLVETLAGVYRAYYELVHWKDELENKVQTVIILDGYENQPKEHLMMYEKARIYNSFVLKTTNM